MGSQELTPEDRLKRFLYTATFHGAYITGNPDKHICRMSCSDLFQWVKIAPQDFIKILLSINDDPLLVRRANLFYITAEVMQHQDVPLEVKQEVKEVILKLVKSDEDFFDFVKFYTQANRKKSHKITTTLKKLIVKFYKSKTPQEFAECVTRYDSHHGWAHKDLFKLCHLKCENALSGIILKFVLYGVKELPDDGDDETKKLVTYLKKSHELRTTEDEARAATLIKELHLTANQVNSKLNKNEQVWLAALGEMTTREILQNVYRFYKFGFLKPNSQFQAKINEILSDAKKNQQCNLHPVEVYIHLRFFEKGGKIMDPKLIEYLQKKEIKEETLKKITTPVEPKCKSVVQSINRCLKLSYDNVTPTGKRYLVTIDVTEKTEVNCFHNKRITFLEAAVAIIRFLSKVEKNVSVAVFKDSQINFVDISKSHSAIEKLQEHKASYILPTAPISYALNKRKNFDVFLNFMSCNWLSSVPQDVREKMEKMPEALNKYAKKMKLPDTRVVKCFLSGPTSAYSENSRNILSVGGFSVEVPRILEAFCRGQFC